MGEMTPLLIIYSEVGQNGGYPPQKKNMVAYHHFPIKAVIVSRFFSKQTHVAEGS